MEEDEDTDCEREMDKITRFLDHYEVHFDILICENFSNNKHYLKQQDVFSTASKEVIERFIDEHSLLVQRNSYKNWNELPKQPRPEVIRFTTICDGCKGSIVYNTVSCGEDCALLTMADRISSFKS
jgi:hypothetical protein